MLKRYAKSRLMLWLLSVAGPGLLFLGVLIIIITIGRGVDLDTQFTQWAEGVDLSRYEDSRAAMDAFLNGLTDEQAKKLPMPIDTLREILSSESASVRPNQTVTVEKKKETYERVGTDHDPITGESDPIYDWVTRYPTTSVTLGYRAASYEHRLPWQLIFALACVTDDKADKAKSFGEALKPVFHWKTEYTKSRYSFGEASGLPYTNYSYSESPKIITTYYKPVVLLDYVECFDKVYRYKWKQVSDTESSSTGSTEKRTWELASVETSDNTQMLLGVMAQEKLTKSDIELMVEIIKGLPDGDELAYDLQASFNVMSDYIDATGPMEDLDEFIPTEGGVLAWPCPASHRITSPFGNRIHPILKTKKLHTGIDVGLGSNNPVYSARDGKVIFAGWKGGYGNTVMIDHGSGMVTLYAHNNRVAVTVGTKVSRGQLISISGNTGRSTGPHLHFEVRVNGQPKNPLNYMAR